VLSSDVVAGVARDGQAISANAALRLLAWTVADARGATVALDGPLALTVGKRLDRQAQSVRAGHARAEAGRAHRCLFDGGQFREIDVEPGHDLGVHRGLFIEMRKVVCKVFKADAATWNAGRRAKQPASATRTLTYLVQLLRDAAYSKLSLHHKVYQLEQLLLIELHRLDVTARGTADRANDFAGFANARTLTIRVESTAASASRPPPHRILR